MRSLGITIATVTTHVGNVMIKETENGNLFKISNGIAKRKDTIFTLSRILSNSESAGNYYVSVNCFMMKGRFGERNWSECLELILEARVDGSLISFRYILTGTVSFQAQIS